MRKILFFYLFILSIILLPTTLLGGQISFLACDSDTYLINNALIRYFSSEDIKKERASRDFIAASEVVIVDVMIKELTEYLSNETDFRRKRFYAIRGSRDDEGLKRKGFIFDPDIKEYLQNMIYRVANIEFDKKIPYSEVKKLPSIGIYHPDSRELFTEIENYLTWYKCRKRYASGNPWTGMIFYSSSLIEGQVERINYLIERLEDEGFNVIAAFGKDIEVINRFFMEKNKKSRVALIVAFSLKFYSALNDQVRTTLKELNIPIINAINLYNNTITEWEKDPIGIQPMEVVWTLANPEISGLIEPSPLSGKVRLLDRETGKVLFVHRPMFVHRPIKENIELLIPRLKKWVQLKKKKNKQKKVAILYYNHSQGKQNVGASYLNVFKSLEIILKRMRKEGYSFEGTKDLSDDIIKDLVLKYGRNIGSWAPGELKKMVREDRIIKLPVRTHQTSGKNLPTVVCRAAGEVSEKRHQTMGKGRGFHHYDKGQRLYHPRHLSRECRDYA
ncbi:MAG: cobaltochelatase subunit CobN [Deltaproteobacteria bacterium]|nr:cobaltochelatase subunit CobN [Deltaproteobacteria bacterium]